MANPGWLANSLPASIIEYTRNEEKLSLRNPPASVIEFIRKGKKLLLDQEKAETYYTLTYPSSITLEPQKHRGLPESIPEKVHHWEYWLYPRGCVPGGVSHRCGVIMNQTLQHLNLNLSKIQKFETMYKSFKQVDSLPKDLTSHNVLGPIAYTYSPPTLESRPNLWHDPKAWRPTPYRYIPPALEYRPYYWESRIEYLSTVTFGVAIRLFLELGDLWLHKTRPSKLDKFRNGLASYADTLCEIISRHTDLNNSTGFNVYNDLERLEVNRERIKRAMDRIDPREDGMSYFNELMIDSRLKYDMPLFLVGRYYQDSDENKWQSYILQIDQNKISYETDSYQKSYIWGLWPQTKRVGVPENINCEVGSVRSIKLIKNPAGVSLSMTDTQTPTNLKLKDTKAATEVCRYINDVISQRNKPENIRWRRNITRDPNLSDLEIAKQILNNIPIIRFIDSTAQAVLLMINNAQQDLQTRVDAFDTLNGILRVFAPHISFDDITEYQIAKPSLEYPLHICKDDLEKLIKMVSAAGSPGDLKDKILEILDLYLTGLDNNIIMISDMGALAAALSILGTPGCSIATMERAACVGLKILKVIFPNKSDPLHWNKMKGVHKKQLIGSMKMTTFSHNMETNTGCISVQALYLYILDTIGCDPENLDLIMSTDAIRCVITAMRTHLNHREIQLHAYKILLVIANSNSHFNSRQTMKSFGPADHVLTVMKIHSYDLDMQRDGFELLIKLDAPMTAINDALRHHREETPDDLKQLGEKFTLAESRISPDAEFYFLRGNYYYKAAQKQTDNSVKASHLGNALVDCNTSIRHNAYHAESLSLVSIVKKELSVIESTSLRLEDLSEKDKAQLPQLRHSDLTEEEKLVVEELDENDLTEEEKAEVYQQIQDARRDQSAWST